MTGRNSYDPAGYSPATRRAVKAITNQVDWAIVHLPTKSAMPRTIELANIVARLSDLKMIAEAHRQWSDSDDLSARMSPYLSELGSIRLGIPPRTEADVDASSEYLGGWRRHGPAEVTA